MFELEHAVESAVPEAVPKTAGELIEWIPRLGSLPYTRLDSALDNRCCYFIELPAKKRPSSLVHLMETFDPMYEFLAGRGRLSPAMIPPSEFAGGEREWPEFDW